MLVQVSGSCSILDQTSIKLSTVHPEQVKYDGGLLS